MNGDMTTVGMAVLASIIAGAFTGVGALPVLFTTHISKRLQAALLGFGAGVMLAATAFSLIVPAIETATPMTGTGTRAALVVAIGVIAGGVFILLAHRYSPHEHFIKGPEGKPSRRLSRIWLFIIAIVIHNFPEGLAVGVAFGLEEISDATALTIGISLQNMPEGLVVALALVTEHYSKARAIGIALLTGFMQPLGALVGSVAITASQALLPWGLAFAAGAMLYVISNEVIPESHSHGHERASTMGLMVGFVLMMFMEVAIGG
jgi:ZIP family zinc transporter